MTTLLCMLILGLAVSNIVMVSMLKEMRDKLNAIEDRCDNELESFRERVKTVERQSN